VRDYKVASGGSGRLNSASPFNIKVKSLTLRDFNSEEVAALYTQHTEATGQRFTPDAIAHAYELTQGQPWLVNAIAKEIVEELLGIELKVWRNGRSDPLMKGLKQVDEYLARLGLETGWLVIFDQRQNQPSIEERTRTEIETTMTGRRVTVIRA
jgi:hypothetical protein